MPDVLMLVHYVWNKKLDLEQVRGEFESNSVVAAIKEHIKQKIALGNELIKKMRRINK
ncbi:MAG: hypothetical protein Q7J06_03780 [Bacteroidales bacterium]|nr:hypothetical protein [Bacteroidales bacterium]